MPCTPFGLAAGLFTTTESFHAGPEGAFDVGVTPGDPASYQIRHSGSVVATRARGIYADALSWNLFPGGHFLAVQLVRDTGVGFVDYRLDVWDVTTPGSPTDVSPTTGPLSGSGTPQLHCDPSTDGKAYHLWIGEGGNQSHNHAVYRSESGAHLCSGMASSATGQRFAERTGDDIRIFLGPPSGAELGRCPLPAGRLTVVEGCQVFPEVVIGGPPGTTTSTRTYTLRNAGDDCLVVSAIADVAPFRVTATMPTMPVSLSPTESMTVVVEFAPTATGSTGETHLAITRSPAAGDDHLCAEGTARDPMASLSFAPTGLSFGTHPAGTPVGGGRLTITNNGELPVTIEVPAPPPGLRFDWASVPPGTSLGITSSRDVAVTFTPLEEGPASGTLIVHSSLPGSPHSFPLSGTGCVAAGELSFPLAPFPAFGDVEVGYRNVRFVTVANTGDGDALLRARISDTTTGFALADATGSITSAEAQRVWTIPPAVRCGPGTTGSGEVLVAVNFWATGAPGPRSATLTLEQLSGGAVVASQDYPLSAVVVPGVALDLAAALDRSGSMADPVCERQKSDAAIEAGQLLVQLMRPDVDDRVATVRFNQNPEPIQPITPVSESTAPTQDAVAAGLNATSLAPDGSTSIAGAAMAGLAEIETPRPAPPGELRKVVVILTDGMDNTAYQDPATGTWYSVMGGRSRRPSSSFGIPWSLFDMVDTEPLSWPMGVSGYAVGIGAEENIDRGQLAALSTGSGGFYLVVTCLAGDQFFQLEKYFLQIFMDAVGMASVEDPVFTINPGEVQRFEFDLLRGDVAGLVTVFDKDNVRLPFRIVSPEGEELSMTAAPPGFATRSGTAPTARFLEFKVPQTEPHRYAGRWVVEVAHTGRGPGEGDNVTHGYAKTAVYGIAIGAGSNFRMQPYVSPGPVSVGEPIRLTAVLSEAGWPAMGAQVTVEATSPSGRQSTWTLRDDGAHGDGDADDGEYAELYDRATEGGSYLFTFRAEGRTRDGEPVRREATLAKYVQGRLSLDPTPNRGDGGALDKCCQLLARWLPLLGAGLLIVIVLLLWQVLFR